MKKQSFLGGAAVLAAASVLCKIMSAAMKIPLDRFFLHEEGIAVYQSAYSIYNVFLAFCVTGIPIALSGLVASADKDRGIVLTKSTNAFVTLFCSVCAVLLFVFSRPVAFLLAGGGRPEAELSLKVLSPALLVMGIISSGRGYFQGKSQMTPSAVSSLFESLIKVCAGIAICAVTYKAGIAYGAFGAMCGVSLSAFGAAFILHFFLRKNVRSDKKPTVEAAMQVVKLSLPMTLGALGFTGVMLIDSLSSSAILAGEGVSLVERLRLFGYLTRANTVYNLPATVITAVTASAVPAIAGALAKKDSALLEENILRGVKLIFIAAVPCTLGIMLFSKEILILLYNGSQHHTLLILTGVMLFIMPYIQTTTAILQTLGRVWLPITITAASLLIKALLNVLFIRAIGIEGAPLATIAAFVPAFVFNSVLLFRWVKAKKVLTNVAKIFFCAAIACIGARALYSIRESNVMLLGSIGFAAAVYAAAVVKTGCIKLSEFKKD